jgi:hypothetical protein
MPCLNCGAGDTIKAHLIPQAFVKEVRGDGKGYALTTGDVSSFQPSQNGRYDDAILCAPCDNILGKDEKYAFETLTAIRRSATHIVDRAFMVDGVEGDRLLRFAAGTVWKFTLTKPHYGRIDIGPYRTALQALLYGSAADGGAVDAFLMKLHSGDDESYLNRAPSPQRYEGVNFVRFSVGGFIVLLKLDRRPVTKLPIAAWIRENTSILIPAIAFNEVEEGRTVLGARRAKRLDAYLQRVSIGTTVH